MRDLIATYGYDGDSTPIIAGSALLALKGENTLLGKETILKLLEQVDQWIATPERDYEKPFLMPIQVTYTIPDRGTVVSGKVERGSITVGSPVEIIGYNTKIKTAVSGRYYYATCKD